MVRKIALLIFDLLLILVVTIFIMNEVVSTYLKKEIAVRVNGSGNGYYLTINKLKVNLLTGGVNAGDISFFPKDKRSSSYKVDRLVIERFKFFELIQSEKINIGTIRINKASAIIKPIINESKDAEIDTTKLSFYNLFREKYSSLSIGEIIVDNPSVNYYRNTSDTSLFLTSAKGRFHIVKLLIDSATVYGLNKPFKADRFDISLSQIKNVVGDSLYTLTIGEINLSYYLRTLNLVDISMHPNYSKKEFSRRTGKQTDRFIVNVPSINFTDINVKRLIENLECFSTAVIIDSMRVDIYRDKYVTELVRNKKMIRRILNEIDIPIRITRAYIKNSFVLYEELMPPAKIAGKISFADLNASIDSITNIKGDENNIFFKAKCKLDNKSLVEAEIVFPTNQDAFHTKGYVKNILMSSLNSMLESTSGSTITNGTIDSLHFDFNANPEKITGRFTMLYKDLRVAAKNIETNDTLKVGLRIKTFIANKIILNQENPEPGKPVRQEKIVRDYNKNKFMINNIWKSILQGIQMTIGAPVK